MYRVKDGERELSMTRSTLDRAESEIRQLRGRVDDAVSQIRHWEDEFDVSIIPVFTARCTMCIASIHPSVCLSVCDVVVPWP